MQYFGAPRGILGSIPTPRLPDLHWPMQRFCRCCRYPHGIPMQSHTKLLGIALSHFSTMRSQVGMAWLLGNSVSYDELILPGSFQADSEMLTCPENSPYPGGPKCSCDQSVRTDPTRDGAGGAPGVIVCNRPTRRIAPPMLSACASISNTMASPLRYRMSGLRITRSAGFATASSAIVMGRKPTVSRTVDRTASYLFICELPLLFWDVSCCKSYLANASSPAALLPAAGNKTSEEVVLSANSPIRCGVILLHGAAWFNILLQLYWP